MFVHVRPRSNDRGPHKRHRDRRPSPQIDASSIALPISSTSGSNLILPRVGADLSHRANLMPSDAIFCEPSRHGTHLPHDSLRKNSIELTACSAMSRSFGINDQPRAERLRWTQRAEKIQLQFKIEDVELGRSWIEPRRVPRVPASSCYSRGRAANPSCR